MAIQPNVKCNTIFNIDSTPSTVVLPMIAAIVRWTSYKNILTHTRNTKLTSKTIKTYTTTSINPANTIYNTRTISVDSLFINLPATFCLESHQ